MQYRKRTPLCGGNKRQVAFVLQKNSFGHIVDVPGYFRSTVKFHPAAVEEALVVLRFNNGFSFSQRKPAYRISGLVTLELSRGDLRNIRYASVRGNNSESARLCKPCEAVKCVIFPIAAVINGVSARVGRVNQSAVKIKQNDIR